MNESLVHVSMRIYLKNDGWKLIAGEYPGGSDDELYVLRIKDPRVARDNSPDPRRHSSGEFVPDLFAYKNGEMLVIEAKPSYDIGDKEKLIDLIYNNHRRLIADVKKFCDVHGLLPDVDVSEVEYIPTLAFGNTSYKGYSEDAGFAHIYVKNIKEAKLVRF